MRNEYEESKLASHIIAMDNWMKNTPLRTELLPVQESLTLTKQHIEELNVVIDAYNTIITVLNKINIWSIPADILPIEINRMLNYELTKDWYTIFDSIKWLKYHSKQ